MNKKEHVIVIIKNFIKNIKSNVMNTFIFLIEKKLGELEEYFLTIKKKIGRKILSL